SVIEYTTEEYEGTWVVVEHTQKGHVHTAYHGKVYDYYCGEIVESITRSESPTPEQPNPDVSETVWANSITNATGSAAMPVPTMSDTTYAESIQSSTTADEMQSSTTVTGDMTETTTAGSISSTSTVAGEISDTTSASSISSTTTATTI